MKKKHDNLEEYWQKRNEQYARDEMNYSGPHCCLSMHYAVDKTDPENISPDSYDPRFRGYYLAATRGYGYEKINFCPRCGIKLPEELSDVWYNIIRNELHLEPNSPKDRKQIPAEFLTDEWWKKRGL